ncbi:MAG: type III-B CRISPR-associated protein Cas10/Cmr2 [Candidatus Eisenbacteria bacterium]|nr:type III-B CRISPR-associated protein Cas10/Cmr2 [Candidatus Eisenbacteria bacterium]
MGVENKGASCLLVCEIGPIADFIRHSRKTKDYWSASFLFSYLMSEVARAILNEGGKIYRPDVSKNPLVTRRAKAKAGTVPDQIFAIVRNESKDKVKQAIEKAMHDALEDLATRIDRIKEDRRKSNGNIDREEVRDYINFSYIFHGHVGEFPTYGQNQEAEKKIKMRSFIRVFDQRPGGELKKWEKCNLCGDRKAVFSTPVSKDGDLYDDERICSVCLFKRFLPEALKDLAETPSFDSTSDIAAVPFHELRIRLSSSFLSLPEIAKLASEYDALQRACKETGEEWGGGPGEICGRCLFDDGLDQVKPFREAFKKLEDRMVEVEGSYSPFVWLTRPFYSIVYMDGDNLRRIFENNSDEFPKYVPAVSGILSHFASLVPDVVHRHHGQLIYVGGDDVNFVIHPEYLLECIAELTSTYNRLFAENGLTKGYAASLTLSAGAVVCYHKYPLSETIRRACQVMTDRAKSQTNKNATAIQLIKGHTETLTFTLSNHKLPDLLELLQKFIDRRISRTTPHRIAAEKELLVGLIRTDEVVFESYIASILSGTRDSDRRNGDAERNAKLISSFATGGTDEEKVDTMIDCLLYARFLTGDR